MRTRVPVRENRGLESVDFGRFGSLTFFIVHDTETGDTVAAENGNSHRTHGSCNPMQAIGGLSVGALKRGGLTEIAPEGGCGH